MRLPASAGYSASFYALFPGKCWPDLIEYLLDYRLTAAARETCETDESSAARQPWKAGLTIFPIFAGHSGKVWGFAGSFQEKTGEHDFAGRFVVEIP